jgi:cytochrome c oxidase subunit 2
MDQSFHLFPAQASTQAQQVDALCYFLLTVTVSISLLIAILILYFAIKYKVKTGIERGVPIYGSMRLEMFWTFTPLCIAMVIFGWGAKVYVSGRQVPDDAMEIYVVGKQWMWKIQHPEGRQEINELHVPLGRNVKLTMISQDVIHSFFIPAFRVKQDVLPGRYVMEWFQATKLGEYHLFCTQYCGTDHAKMIGRVVVMDPSKYAEWLTGRIPDETAAEAGTRLYHKYLCDTCHGVRAPTLAGVYRSPVKLQDGNTVLADDDYIRESILYPSAKVVAGFPNIMPTFKGQITEDEILQLIEYIKSLRDNATQGDSKK